MNILTGCIAAAASVPYLILVFQTLNKNRKESEKLSFSSFLLWSIIDIIMLVNTVRADNDYVLILTYTVLTIALTIILAIKEGFEWNKKSDTLVACIAFACLVISYLTSPFIGVIAGASSIVAAGIPNLINFSKQEPSKKLYTIIGFFFLAPLLSCIQVFSRNGTAKDYIYPLAAIGYWAAIFLCTKKISKTTKLKLKRNPNETITETRYSGSI